MKSALAKLREVSEASKNYPSVVPLIGGVLELEENLRGLEQSKVNPSQPDIPPQELTRGNLQLPRATRNGPWPSKSISSLPAWNKQVCWSA
jgi:hypothetical protein